MNEKFYNWVRPTREDLEIEYSVEYKLHIRPRFGDIFPTFQDFRWAVERGKERYITKEIDYRIGNRSRCVSIKEIFEMIRSYRSYPKYRNEETVLAIDDGYRKNRKMTMPIIIERGERNKLWCMSGNTRMDLAYINDIIPKVIILILKRYNTIF
jgi:hypothetical protein